MTIRALSVDGLLVTEPFASVDQRARCDECEWEARTRDCRDEARAHTRETGHDTYVMSSRETRYAAPPDPKARR